LCFPQMSSNFCELLLLHSGPLPYVVFYHTMARYSKDLRCPDQPKIAEFIAFSEFPRRLVVCQNLKRKLVINAVSLLFTEGFGVTFL
jgi:hypothetical protein